MTSRKKTYGLSILLSFILLQQITLAQTNFSYTPNTPAIDGKFGLNLPAINTNPPVPTAGTPYYTVFIEYGNGFYLKPSNSISGIVNTYTSYTYKYNIPSGSNAVTTVSGWYDTTPRPPRNLSIIAANTGGTLPLPNQVTLPPGNKPHTRIAILPCVPIVVPGDTMVVAITYKPYIAAGADNIVAFFYNKLQEGGNFFNAVNRETTYNFDNTQPSNNAQPTKAIRMHNGERIFTSITELVQALPGIPQAVRTKLQTDGQGYTNTLYFVIPSIPVATDPAERNIFVSLAPTSDTQSYSGTTSDLKATITQYNNTNVLLNDYNNSPLTINLVSRDPNEITVTPVCLESASRDGFYNRLIPVTLKFQNDGAGIAMHVKNTVIVPDGITIPTSLSNVYLHVNGTSQLFKPWPSTDKNTYKIEGKKITFFMKDIRLQGSLQNDLNKRRGEITFTLWTNPNPPIPECMYLDLAIVFINRDGTSNAPVKDSALIRTHCISANFPCPRLPKATKLPDTR